jgi:hypothetical protein
LEVEDSLHHLLVGKTWGDTSKVRRGTEGPQTEGREGGREGGRKEGKKEET